MSIECMFCLGLPGWAREFVAPGALVTVLSYITFGAVGKGHHFVCFVLFIWCCTAVVPCVVVVCTGRGAGYELFILVSADAACINQWKFLRFEEHAYIAHFVVNVRVFVAHGEVGHVCEFYSESTKEAFGNTPFRQLSVWVNVISYSNRTQLRCAPTRVFV